MIRNGATINNVDESSECKNFLYVALISFLNLVDRTSVEFVSFSSSSFLVERIMSYIISSFSAFLARGQRANNGKVSVWI